VFIKQEFKKTLGYELNLDNPKTLNEKIQWLNLNVRTPMYTLCADKFAVRKYIEEKIGSEYLVPLIYHTKNPMDIVPENLPGFPFIIKTNNGSGGGIIVRDKSKIDWQSVQKTLAKALKQNFYYVKKEWQYKNIKPCIVVEKLLMDNKGNIPFDYKLHCFNGRLYFIQVDMDRHGDHKRILYDEDWKFIDCQWGKYGIGNIVEKPILFHKMRSLAETIAKEFCYVRIDLYNIGSEIYFGEMTFTPVAGLGVFKPNEWDRKFGDMLRLPL